MRTYSVYIHTTPKGKRYVGITSKKPETRWNCGNGYKKQIVFFNAIVKYGWDNILHEIVAENLSEKAAKAMEVELISRHMTQNRRYGYNCTAGGDGMVGYITSEETKAKLSKINKGKCLNDEHKAKISGALKGKQKSDETIAKLSAANKGKHHSDEARAKMSESKKGHRHSEESYRKQAEAMRGKTHTAESKQKMSESRKPYKKEVYQYTVDGEMVKVWDSLTDAISGLREDRPSTGINNCVAGRSKLAYGFRWAYEPLQGEVCA